LTDKKWKIENGKSKWGAEGPPWRAGKKQEIDVLPSSFYFQFSVRELGVGLQENVKFEQKGKEIRGVSRLNSRVRVAIECSEDGKAVRAEGYTKDISARGCLAVVPHAFAVGQKVRVINLVNQNAGDGYLIWRGHEGPAGWELGIELQDPMEDFWGLEF